MGRLFNIEHPQTNFSSFAEVFSRGVFMPQIQPPGKIQSPLERTSGPHGHWSSQFPSTDSRVFYFAQMTTHAP
jgi:hypothetical protein